MDRSSEGYIKKFLLVVVLLAALTTGYKYIFSNYTWGIEAKYEKSGEKNQELYTLEDQLHELNEENERLQYQIEEKEKEITYEVAENEGWYDVSDYIEYTPEFKEKLVGDIEALKKDTRLITQSPLEEQVLHVATELYGSYWIGTEFGANSNYKASVDEESQIYTLMNNADRNDKKDIFILGPWGMSIEYKNDAVSRYLEFTSVADGLGITNTETNIIDAMELGEE